MITGQAGRGMRRWPSWSQRAMARPCRLARGGAGTGHDTPEDETSAVNVTGTAADMAKAVWRQAKAILEELHDLGADEVRSRLGAAPGPAVPSAC
jgi:hypothetical protein